MVTSQHEKYTSISGPEYEQPETTIELTIRPDTITVKPGDTAELSCVSSNPNINLNWNKYQDRLPYNAQDNNGQLTLYQITENDAGVYICTGQDENGNTLTAQAQITGLPFITFFKHEFIS